MNEIKKPLLSIIVPTKNREKYALSVTIQILSFPYSNIQLIVQNNSDTNTLEDMLSEYKNDNRLKYNYYEGVLSTIDNFSQAIALCDGEYVCAIGDDDGINPEIVKIVEWAKLNNIDAIKPELQANYIWPDSGAICEDNGVLTISEITGKVKFSCTKEELEKLMAEGCLNYFKRGLVKIYHGIVKRKFMEQIKKISGNYFGGLAPDIYSCVALSSLIENVICIDYPLTIAGACNKSSTADSVAGKHTGRLEDAPHFNGHYNYKWANEVPKFYSVDTIWADSALASVRDMKLNDLLSHFECIHLTFRCLRNSPMYSKIIIENYLHYCSGKKINKIKAINKLGVYILKSIKLKLSKKNTSSKSNIFSMNNIIDITAAEKSLTNYLNENNLNIDKVIDNLNDLCKFKTIVHKPTF